MHQICGRIAARQAGNDEPQGNGKRARPARQVVSSGRLRAREVNAEAASSSSQRQRDTGIEVATEAGGIADSSAPEVPGMEKANALEHRCR